MNYQDWRRIPYPNENGPVKNWVEPSTADWRLTYFREVSVHGLIEKDGRTKKLHIAHPSQIPFQDDIKEVRRHIEQATEHDIHVLTYWGLGAVTKQWTPITERLIDAYNVSPSRAARILSCVNTAALDSFIVTWKLKYAWNVARPVQLDSTLKTHLPTPKHPSYPAGHSVVPGTIEKVLAYFFPTEAARLKALADECSDARITAGVHFVADCREGIKLGRQIGELIIRQLKEERDHQGKLIDKPITVDRNPPLFPPPYTQVIPFPD